MSRTKQPILTGEPPSPPRERGTGKAIFLALLMHALLAFLLYHGIQWPNSTPAGTEAELWTDVPDTAAPPPPPPAPPAPVVAPAPPVQDDQAEIALQQQKRREAEARKAEELQAVQQARIEEQRKLDEKRAAELAAAAAAAEAAHLAEQKVQAKALERQRQQAQDKLKQLQLQQQKELEQQKLEAQKQLQQQKLEQQKQLEAQKQAQAKAEAAKAATAKAEAAKAAAAKAAAAKAAAAKAAAANAKLDTERASRLAQLQGMASGQGLANAGTGNGSGGNAASPGYPDKVKRQVKPHITYGGAPDGLTTVVMVHCSPSGSVLSVSITRHSSNPAWDNAVVEAVNASSPLPPDVDGKTPPNIRITFHASEGG